MVQNDAATAGLALVKTMCTRIVQLLCQEHQSLIIVVAVSQVDYLAKLAVVLTINLNLCTASYRD